MRFEQIIAAVTRNLVQPMVREIEAARLFVGAGGLHAWLNRKPLDEMPSRKPTCSSGLSDRLGDLLARLVGGNRSYLLQPIPIQTSSVQINRPVRRGRG